jgi:hypothetical protein
MLIVCKNNLSQSYSTNCKIIIIEGEGMVFLVRNQDQFFGEDHIRKDSLRFLEK